MGDAQAADRFLRNAGFLRAACTQERVRLIDAELDREHAHAV